MPFGLKNVAQAFQRLMDSVLRDLMFLFIYLDNSLVANRLNQHGLTVNPAKCQFRLPSIDFLGNFTEDGRYLYPRR
ncbi:hypothetical protein AAFF_G00399770 [Aldrovandia affinis]|uniref:Reverse transcriptase domain-containing protein n=1 Tax=Aldrovandia affinis TaxID=143900 RepID=A0AAD7SD76_9TELE|nr:hypothetical protein AAFF_G00399770 [Aldrovandia affinis]